MAKRILLFVLTNILVIVTISIVLNVLGVQPYLTRNGIDYKSLMVFCLVWGMGGALISLSLSRIMAKMMLGVKTNDPSRPGEYQWLYNSVEQLAKAAGLPKTPEVGVYDSPELNAFATGPSKRRSLVAFSSGLLQRMNQSEIEGVAAHEIAHIGNGDMVTMTLLQGIVNAFVMFFARVIAFAISQNVREEARYMVRFMTTLVLEIALSFLGLIVVAWFSRYREFRADAGGASVVGREKMAAALDRLRRHYDPAAPAESGALATLKISGKSSGFTALFATHPPLELRIAKLLGRA